VIPPRRGRRIERRYDRDLFKSRFLVEQFFGRIKRCRRVATRYEKLAVTFLAMVLLACILVWIAWQVSDATKGDGIARAVSEWVSRHISRTIPARPSNIVSMVIFDHEKLEVYCVAVEYADAADAIAAELKRGNAHIRDQLRRASDSIVNNVAEGAGEFQPAEKMRFYRIALRSSTESAATLHTCQRRQLGALNAIEDARKLLKRVVEMLTRLIHSTARRLPPDRDRDRDRDRYRGAEDSP
jgi:four helix bundle protein